MFDYSTFTIPCSSIPLPTPQTYRQMLVSRRYWGECGTQKIVRNLIQKMAR